MKDDHSPRPSKNGSQRDEVAFAEPIRDAARNADRHRVSVDQLGRHRIDRVTVPTPAASLIETVDEQNLTSDFEWEA